MGRKRNETHSTSAAARRCVRRAHGRADAGGARRHINECRVRLRLLNRRERRERPWIRFEHFRQRAHGRCARRHVYHCRPLEDRGRHGCAGLGDRHGRRCSDRGLRHSDPLSGLRHRQSSGDDVRDQHVPDERRRQGDDLRRRSLRRFGAEPRGLQHLPLPLSRPALPARRESRVPTRSSRQAR
jgi:hypothetical protein